MTIKFQLIKSFLMWSFVLSCLYLWNVAELSAALSREKISFHTIKPNASSLITNDIVTDKYGFVWLATREGLNRFDSHLSIVYLPVSGNGNTIADIHVNRLLIDHRQELWVGTKKGLNRYNYKDDTFSLIQSDNSQASQHLRVSEIYEDRFHNLWVGTVKNGILLVSKDRKKMENISKIHPELEILSKQYIRAIVEDSQNNILIGTKRGLYRFDRTNKNLVKLLLVDSEGNQYSNKVNSLFMLDTTLIIGTEKGLIRFDTEQNLVHSPSLTMAHSNSKLWSSDIRSITTTPTNDIIVSTKGEGLFLVDHVFSNVQQYQATNEDNNSPLSNVILRSYKDDNGQIWLATDKGPARLFTTNKEVSKFKSTGNSPTCMTAGAVYSLLKTKNNRFLFSVAGKGIHQFDPSQGKCQLHKSFDNEKSKDALKMVISMYEDPFNLIWLGTLRQGLVSYDIESGKYEHYVADKHNVNSLGSDVIVHVTGDQNGNLWVATYNKGLFHFNRDMQVFTRIEMDDQQFSDYRATVSIKDSKGNLWIGTRAYGLFVLSKGELRFKAVQDKSNLIAKEIYALTEDRNGKIWIGSKGYGANLYDPVTGNADLFNVQNSNLSSNMVWSIVEDNAGNIWFAGDNGLSVLERSSKEIKNFNKTDGLQGNVYSSAVFYDRASNELWHGGDDGFDSINPESLLAKKKALTANITKFELFYKSVGISTQEKITPLKQNIILAKSIMLEHDQNVFSFEFSAMEHLKRDSLYYGVKLEGYDNDWNIVDSNRRYASYTNIPSGNYVFKVKVSDNKRVWADDYTSIDIIIATPWWMTYWAFGLYFSCLILAIYGFSSYRTIALRKYTKRLEKSVSNRTEELAEEKNKIQKLLSLKNKEFATISHEFRTPLTLVLGPLKQLMLTETSEKKSSKMLTIKRNSLRLMRMVDQLLYMEKFRVAKEGFSNVIHLQPLILHLSNAFQDLCKEKSIQFELQSNEDIWLKTTPDAIEKILLNLLSNAVKYTPAGGKVVLDSVLYPSRTKNNKQCKITITDTGIGIPVDMQNKIFERYTRVLNAYSESVTGAGIGLSLVKELVESHNGKIELISTPDKGSCFTVFLPATEERIETDSNTLANREALEIEVENLSGESIERSVNQEQSEADLNYSGELTSVLVIEDNADMRKYIVETINQNYHCLVAENGQEGIDMALEYIPDLIISDVMMPIKDGFEVSEILKQDVRTSHIPIILLTARGDRESRLTGWKSQVDEYLTKPFDEEELLIRISNLLSIRSLLRQRFGQQIIQQVPDTIENITNDFNPIDGKFIEDFETVIRQHYMDSQFGIKELASHLALSVRQLQRKLKGLADISPVDYLRNFRLTESLEQLKKGDAVKLVAYNCGFSSVSYFSTCFKAKFNMTPKQAQV